MIQIILYIKYTYILCIIYLMIILVGRWIMLGYTYFYVFCKFSKNFFIKSITIIMNFVIVCHSDINRAKRYYNIIIGNIIYFI